MELYHVVPLVPLQQSLGVLRNNFVVDFSIFYRVTLLLRNIRADELNNFPLRINFLDCFLCKFKPLQDFRSCFSLDHALFNVLYNVLVTVRAIKLDLINPSCNCFAVRQREQDQFVVLFDLFSCFFERSAGRIVSCQLVISLIVLIDIDPFEYGYED